MPTLKAGRLDCDGCRLRKTNPASIKTNHGGGGDESTLKFRLSGPVLRTSDLRALYQSQETCLEWAPRGDSGAGGLRTNYLPGSLQC